MEISEQCDENPSGEEVRRDATGCRSDTGAWRACVEGRAPEAGRVAARRRSRRPDTGWLVIAGRRGHYQFCDTIRAYHLGTGAAFIDDSCTAARV